MRAVCQNSLVVSVLALGEEHHYRLATIILASCKPVEAWHCEMNRRCRSADGTEKWLVEQLAGGLDTHLRDLWAALVSPSVQQSAGFCVEKQQAMAMSEGELVTENDYADTFGQLVSSLVFQRSRRTIWMSSGWPWRMTRVLASDQMAQETIAEFGEDLRIFREARDSQQKTNSLENILRRHLMRKASVQQFILAMRDREQPGFLQDLRHVVRERARVACGTQIVEDAIGTAKNALVVKTSSRFRKPERAMSSIIKHGVIEQRHKWEGVSVDKPMRQKTARLVKDCFKAKIANRSLPWQEVVSPSDKTAWHSPKAENYGANISDLTLLRSAAAQGDMNTVQTAWVGEVASVRHRLLLGIRDAEGQLSWYHALHHFDSSCVLGWPGRLVSIEGGARKVFLHDMETGSPKLLPIMSLDGVSACTFEWKSWPWTCRQRGVPSSWGMRVVPWIKTGPASALEVAARNCFWGMRRAQIEKFGKLKGAAVTEASSMLEALTAVITAILPGCSQSEMVQILSLRMLENDTSATLHDGLLEIDEALEVLDRNDADVCRRQQQQAKRDIETLSDYTKSFREYREVRPRWEAPAAGEEAEAPRHHQPQLRQIVRSSWMRYLERSHPGRLVWALPAPQKVVLQLVPEGGGGIDDECPRAIVAPALGPACPSRFGMPVGRAPPGHYRRFGSAELFRSRLILFFFPRACSSLFFPIVYELAECWGQPWQASPNHGRWGTRPPTDATCRKRPGARSLWPNPCARQASPHCHMCGSSAW